MKVSWKKAFGIGGFLAVLCGTLAAAIAGVDLLTRGRIEEAKAEKEQNGLRHVFVNAEFSEPVSIQDGEYPQLLKYYTVTAANDSSKVVGRVYSAHGRNGYGEVGLLVGVYKDFSLGNIYVLENTQSYGPTLGDGYLDPYNEAMDKEEAVEAVHCGATFGAKLCRELIRQSQNHYKGGKA